MLPLVFRGIVCSRWAMIVKTLIGLHDFKAAFIRQINVGQLVYVDKVKLTCGTTQQHVGNLLATNRTRLYSCSFFLACCCVFHTHQLLPNTGQHLFAGGEWCLKCTKNALRIAENFCAGHALRPTTKKDAAFGHNDICERLPIIFWLKAFRA